MARRLSFQKIVLGLVVVIVAFPALYAAAQSAPPSSAQAINDGNAAPQDRNRRDDKREEKRDGRHDGDKRSGDGKREGDGGRGERRGDGRFSADFFLEAIKRSDFLFEVAKRDGGALELLAPLMKPEVRDLMGLSPEHAAAADKILADMTKHFEEDITAFKQQAQPDAKLKELFDKRLQIENASFEEYLSTLPTEQRDRLLGIFVQYRNLRALSNRLVAEKLGIDKEDAEKLAKEISNIRRDVFQESGELARRQIQNGKMAPLTEQQSNEHLNKMRTKIDQRIEKQVSKERLDKLKSLRGQPLPAELIEKLDRPPTPPPPKRD